MIILGNWSIYPRVFPWLLLHKRQKLSNPISSRNAEHNLNRAINLYI